MADKCLPGTRGIENLEGNGDKILKDGNPFIEYNELVEQHKEDLSLLEDQDPEFYQHLVEKEKELLLFGNNDFIITKPSNTIPSEELNSLTQKALSGDLSAIQELIDKFASITKNQSSSLIEDSNLSLISFCFQNMDSLFKLLENNLDHSTLATYKSYYLTALLEYLKQCPFKQDDDSSRIVLKHCHEMIHYLVPYCRLSYLFLKELLRIWSLENQVSSHFAFLILYSMAKNFPSAVLSFILKKMVIISIRIFSQNYNENSNYENSLLIKSLIEMYLIDVRISYHELFLLLRQIAISLSDALSNRIKTSLQTLKSSSNITTLKIIASILTASTSKPHLDTNNLFSSLCYPFTQVAIGFASFINNISTFPLRLQCCEFLIHLEAKFHLYVPIAPILLVVLQSSLLDKHFTKNSKAKINHVSMTKYLNLRSNASSQEVQSKLILTTIRLLHLHLSNHATKVAFPEIALPFTIYAKRIVKKSSSVFLKKSLLKFISLVDKTAEIITKRRSEMAVAPSDEENITDFSKNIITKDIPLLISFSRSDVLEKDNDMEHEQEDKKKIISKKRKKKILIESKQETVKKSKTLDNSDDVSSLNIDDFEDFEKD